MSSSRFLLSYFAKMNASTTETLPTCCDLANAENKEEVDPGQEELPPLVDRQLHEAARDMGFGGPVSEADMLRMMNGPGGGQGRKTKDTVFLQVLQDTAAIRTLASQQVKDSMAIGLSVWQVLQDTGAIRKQTEQLKSIDERLSRLEALQDIAKILPSLQALLQQQTQPQPQPQPKEPGIGYVTTGPLASVSGPPDPEHPVASHFFYLD